MLFSLLESTRGDTRELFLNEENDGTTEDKSVFCVFGRMADLLRPTLRRFTTF